MRTFVTLLNREVKSYFHSPIAYVVMGCFLFVTGLTFYAAVSFLNRGPTQVTVVEAFFNTILFWFAYVLVFPLITMRAFSEEYRMGTIETLMTAPVSDLSVVLSKFFGALLFYVTLWLPSLIYFVVFQSVTGGTAAHATGAYWGAYLMLLLVGMFYTAIGCLASALTKNQIIAAVMAFAAITLLFFGGLLTSLVLNVSPFFRDLVGYFSTIEHMAEFSKGVIDTRPIAYYTSATVFLLVLTFQVFQTRKWKA